MLCDGKEHVHVDDVMIVAVVVVIIIIIITVIITNIIFIIIRSICIASDNYLSN